MPFYTYQLAEDSTTISDSPSLSLCTLLSRVHQNHALVAIAPKQDSDPTLLRYADNLVESFTMACRSSPINGTASLKVFSSESAINDYIADKSYEDVDYQDGKIAFAIIFNHIDVANIQWDYSIRVNYTVVYNADDPTVACLYENKYTGNGCMYTYNIPSTKIYSMDLTKPQSAEYLYGYTFTGFSTLQIAVDEFILSQYSIDSTKGIKIRGSVGLMPTKAFQSDNFQYVISSVLGIFFILSFLYPVSRIIRALVMEKELRVKEGKNSMYWCLYYAYSLSPFRHEDDGING